MTARRSIALLLTAALLLCLCACSTGDGGAADGADDVPAAVRESARRAAAAAPKRPEGTWQPAGWPDACTLLVAADGVGLGAPAPSPGALADGSPLPGAKSCRRALRAAPDDVVMDGPTEVTLTVHLVTEDVWSVWGGVQTLESFIRPIDGLGDEAFLTEVGFDEEPEKLWLCVGRTIVRVERSPGTLDLQGARTVLLAVGQATERVLRTLPAGQPPDPDWRPAPEPGSS